VTPGDFLQMLWQYKPEDSYLLLWTWPNKRSHWFRDIAKAGEFAANANGHDIYVGVGLSKADHGLAHRCTSDEVTGITGMWTDLDLKSETHKKPLPGTIPDALTILPASMPPSVLVSTGNGAHPWWLFKEPYMFDSAEDRNRVVRVSARWHTLLRLRAAAKGWAYDRLSDLARVLRIPGTLNHKDPTNPKQVTVLSVTDRRYNLSDFEEFLDEAGIPDPEVEERARREWAERFADKPLVVDTAARIPEDLLNAWMREDMRFQNTWLRQRHDLKDQSNSGYDLALACFGVDAGLAEQQIVDLIVHHRAHQGRPQRSRLDYFQRTIAKAAQRTGGAPVLLPPVPLAAPAPQGAASKDTNGETSSPPDSPEPPKNSPDPKAVLCDAISQALGVEILRLVKFTGKEPTYHMELEQGKIEFTSFAKFTDYSSVRNAIGALTNRIIRKMKPKEWDQVAQMMLDACFIEECTEEEEFEGGARVHLLDYLTETDFIPSVEGQRVQDQRRPLIVDGCIAVSSSDFQSYLNKTKGLNLSVKAAASMLGALGAKKRRLPGASFNRQSRWALPAEFDPNKIRPNGGGWHAE
jgi:hypothetical protein